MSTLKLREPAALPPDPVGDRLTADGRADSPVFSPQLHARVMARLHEQGLEEQDSDQSVVPPRWHTPLRIAGGLAVAAGLAIAAFVLLKAPDDGKPEPLAKTPDIWMPTIRPGELVEPVRDAIAEPTAAVLEDGRYGHVEKDAQRLALFVASQLPTFDR